MSSTVRDVMSREVVALRDSAQFRDIIRIMQDRKFSAFPVLAGLSAADLMTRPAITIRPDATLAAAARTMHGRHVKRLPVVTADRHLLGIVSRTDLLRVYDRAGDAVRPSSG